MEEGGKVQGSYVGWWARYGASVAVRCVVCVTDRQWKQWLHGGNEISSLQGSLVCFTHNG